MNNNDFQSEVESVKATVINSMGKNFKLPMKFIFIGIGVIIALVIVFSNVYILNSNEEALITAFGKYVRTQKSPGLNVKIPFIEEKAVVDVENIRRMEFGYKSLANNKTEDVLIESRMLTADENLILADWAIQFKITDTYNYVFNVDDQIGTFRTIAEAAYRRIVASHSLDDIITNQKDTIQIEVRELLQQICNKYEYGITITAVQLQDAMPPDEVKPAFLEVTSAIEEKNSKINEAKKYENEKLPVARGNAEQIKNVAEGYKQQRINDATGAVSRYIAIQKEYAINPSVTKTRLYLEMIKSVLPNIKEIYIMNDNGDVLKFLPLDTSAITDTTKKAN